jgi:hypothetical protein
MSSRKRRIVDLSVLIRKTAELRKDLHTLINNHPEGHLDPDERIFEHLTSPVWRKPLNAALWSVSGDSIPPSTKKESEAIKWCNDLYEYLKDLVTFFQSVILQPDLLVALPLTTYMPLCAEELIQKLRYQEVALERIRDDLTTSSQTQAADREKLRRDLRAVVDDRGMKNCTDESGLDRDTINDFLRGRNRPHKKTLEKLASLAKSDRR